MTTTALSAVEGTTDDLVQISTVMHTYIKEKNDQALEVALEQINQKPALVKRLFPTAYDKETQRINVERMRDLARNEEQVLELYTEVQLEIARKQGDALIASVGMDLQAALTAFALEKIAAITRSIGESRSEYMARYRPERAEIDQYADIPELHEKGMASLVDGLDTYFESVNSLLRGFVHALESRVTVKKV